MLQDDLFEPHIKRLSDRLENEDINTLFYYMGVLDPFTAQHSFHTSQVSLIFFKLNEAFLSYQFDIQLDRMNMDTLPEEGAMAGLLHDVGKSKIDDVLLHKKEDLTDDDWKRIRRHPEHGIRETDQQNICLSPYIQNAIRDHHERCDGSGYPNQKIGEDISFFGKIIGMIDVFCAITEQRPYRDAREPEDAIAEMKQAMENEPVFEPQFFQRFQTTVDAIEHNYQGEYDDLPDEPPRTIV